MNNPLKPSMSLLSKVGSLILHAEEFMSYTGHFVDKTEFDRLMVDPEIKEWLQSMDELALVPKKR